MKRLIKKIINWCGQLKAKQQPKSKELFASDAVVFWTKELATDVTDSLEDFVEVCRFSRSSLYGKNVYRRVQSLLKKNSIFRADDEIGIHYNPYHVNTILLCKLSEN